MERVSTEEEKGKRLDRGIKCGYWQSLKAIFKKHEVTAHYMEENYA